MDGGLFGQKGAVRGWRRDGETCLWGEQWLWPAPHPWSSLEGFLRAFIQTVDSKSQAPVQKLKGEDGWNPFLLGDGTL